MQTLDLRRQYKQLYAPSARQACIVEVPDLQFVMIDGQVPAGELPGNSTAFQEAVGALYGAAYTLKYAAKQRKEDPLDFPVMALEGLWASQAAEYDRPATLPWDFTLMIMQPDQVTQAMFADALKQLEKKRPSPALAALRLCRFNEGLSVQIMHIGPYSEEPATLERLHAYATDNGYRISGRHHEIYMSDPRRAQPDKMKTVLRYAVEKA